MRSHLLVCLCTVFPLSSLGCEFQEAKAPSSTPSHASSEKPATSEPAPQPSKARTKAAPAARTDAPIGTTSVPQAGPDLRLEGSR